MLRRTTRGLAGLVVIAAVMAFAAGAALAKSALSIHGVTLTQQPDSSWTGPATLDGRKGKLTVTGPIDLASDGKPRTIKFTWKAGKRVVAGCSVNEILQRPHGVMLWDGLGRITRTSRTERKYQGLHISLTGPTHSGDLSHAKVTVASYKPSTTFPAVNC
ncbi:MAG: hypothetical protein QOE28_1204 [Solirubrobacteraceae bacterium]|jgi:hypothetical protein|nr:hypothetical protein [Solirubrobacteraceae bacterium]